MIGDLLAAGAPSVTFPASDGKVSQAKWDAIFDGWEPEKSAVKSAPKEPKGHGRKSNRNL